MILLPYPNKALFPNGRAHWGAKARQTKLHRQWAYAATLADTTRPVAIGRIVATFSPKPRGPAPDRDGCVSSLKSYLDGISDAYHTSDRHFPVPVIQFAERSEHGSVTILLEDVNDQVP